MKKLIYALILLLLAGGLFYFFILKTDTEEPLPEVTPTPEPEYPAIAPEPEPEPGDVRDDTETVIGYSVNQNPITAYHYGTGNTELLFIGGMHGGYSWNTALVAYELMDYLEQNPSVVPDTVTVTVIPVMNPDGLDTVVGTTGRFSSANVPTDQQDTIPGRFNASNVDLNRNFDCDWESTGVWQNTTVDGGTEPFSEPESLALKQYVETNNPSAALVWYSAVGGVFSSNCHNGILPETRDLTNLYAEAAGYPAYEDFDFYKITGDAVNWLAKNNIPAISVLLTTHDDTEWSKNKAGVNAMLDYYSK